MNARDLMHAKGEAWKCGWGCAAAWVKAGGVPSKPEYWGDRYSDFLGSLPYYVKDEVDASFWDGFRLRSEGGAA